MTAPHLRMTTWALGIYAIIVCNDLNAIESPLGLLIYRTGEATWHLSG